MNIMINLDYHRIVYSIEAQMELDSIEDYLYSEMQFSREYGGCKLNCVSKEKK